MLARLFLTADQLHIPQDWHDALVMVLHAMERGEIIHLPKVNSAPQFSAKVVLSRQNMAKRMWSTKPA